MTRLFQLLVDLGILVAIFAFIASLVIESAKKKYRVRAIAPSRTAVDKGIEAAGWIVGSFMLLGLVLVAFILFAYSDAGDAAKQSRNFLILVGCGAYVAAAITVGKIISKRRYP